MRSCLACNGARKNPAEKITHEVLNRIALKEGFSVKHYAQNSDEDINTEDLGLDFLNSKQHLPIQVKSFIVYRDLRMKNLRLNRLLARAKKSPGELKRFLFVLLRDYKKLRLFKNDQEIRKRFKRVIEQMKFFEKLRQEQDPAKIRELLLSIEEYLSIFSAAIRQDKSDVKLFFIVEISRGTNQHKQMKRLENEYSQLIREARIHSQKRAR